MVEGIPSSATLATGGLRLKAAQAPTRFPSPLEGNKKKLNLVNEVISNSHK